jgi:hypothetical protein
MAAVKKENAIEKNLAYTKKMVRLAEQNEARLERELKKLKKQGSTNTKLSDTLDQNLGTMGQEQPALDARLKQLQNRNANTDKETVAQRTSELKQADELQTLINNDNRLIRETDSLLAGVLSSQKATDEVADAHKRLTQRIERQGEEQDHIRTLVEKLHSDVEVTDAQAKTVNMDAAEDEKTITDIGIQQKAASHVLGLVAAQQKAVDNSVMSLSKTQRQQELEMKAMESKHGDLKNSISDANKQMAILEENAATVQTVVDGERALLDKILDEAGTQNDVKQSLDVTADSLNATLAAQHMQMSMDGKMNRATIQEETTLQDKVSQASKVAADDDSEWEYEEVPEETVA